MEGVKSFLSSKGVWGGLVAVAGAVAALLGYTVTPEDMEGVVSAAGAIAAAVGGVVAIVGRVVASKKIG